MTPHTSRFVLIVMGAMGWFFACVFGILACLLAADSRVPDAPWLILAAMVLGPMLASLPLGIILFAAYRAFGAELPSIPSLESKPRLPSKSIGHDQLEGGVNWRWAAFAILCGMEILVLPLTMFAAAAEDDSLVFSIPLNIAVVAAILLVGCWPYRKRASIALCVIHLSGIVIATIAAAIEIESVMISGLFLLVTGIALAIIGRRPRTAHLLFSLSTVAFIVTSFLVIALGEVGQRQAEAPLFAAIVAYQILFVPVGLFVLHREFSGGASQLSARSAMRYFLAATVMVVVAATFATLAYTVDVDVRMGVAVGFAVLSVGGIAVAIGTGGWARWSGKTLRLRKTKFA